MSLTQTDDFSSIHWWWMKTADKATGFWINDNTESKILVNTIEGFFGEILNKLRDQNS